MDTQVSYPRKPTVAAASWNMSANSHHFINTPSAAAKPAGDTSSPPTVSPASMSAAVSSGVRLDIYHPTLNTGISDIRIQDAVLEYPIVRALIVPECDLEARRRCIGLISNVIKAANPVLHFVLLQQKQKVDVVEHYNILAQFLSTVPTQESLVRFWFIHYMEEVRNEVIKVYGHADKLKPSPAQPNSGATTAIANISLTALYAKIRRSRDVLQDLADRVQGAVCIVFWESWDGIYQELAEIVGDQAMETADKGRIFRPSGTAAIYINRRRVERRAEEQRRAREKHLPKNQEATSKHGIDTALLTPPDMMDTFIDYVEDVPKPAAPAVQHESPNMIQIKNSPIASPAAMTETEDGKSSTADHGHWPFKLLTAPIANKSVELIDTTELEEVMNDKRAASTMVDNTEHSELRKRIRLMEN